MPKRDANYMQAQREAIAGAALEVLLDKGIYSTSLRDICKAAGVSIGGLYAHFATKEDVIVAACSVDYANYNEFPLPRTWEDYISANLAGPVQTGSRQSKRFRLSLQFVAEISQMEQNPEGLRTIYHIFRQNLAKQLLRLKELQVIDLPHGIELTTEMHMQIFAGAEYQMASDREIDGEVVKQATSISLASTAGLKSGQHSAQTAAG